MTIAIAWVRKIKDAEELVFVSDSRLSGDGRFFDSSPKILTFSRTDCAIAFAGYTGEAFPLIVQMQRAIDAYGPARHGYMDLYTLRKHLVQIANSMKNTIKNSPGLSVKGKVVLDANFLFGGYSWIKKQFGLWRIVYRKSEDRFEAQQPSWIGFSPQAKKYVVSTNWSQQTSIEKYRKIAFAGDQAVQAKRRLLTYLDKKTPAGNSAKPIDMEPFEVVRDMLRSPRHAETIGGAPQIVKVYQYMHTASLGVFWPSKEQGDVYLQGRPRLGYERIDNWILNPDTLKSEHLSFTKDEKDSPPNPKT